MKRLIKRAPPTKTLRPKIRRIEYFTGLCAGCQIFVYNTRNVGTFVSPYSDVWYDYILCDRCTEHATRKTASPYRSQIIHNIERRCSQAAFEDSRYKEQYGYDAK